MQRKETENNVSSYYSLIITVSARNHLSNYGQTYFVKTWFFEQIRVSETKYGQIEQCFSEEEMPFLGLKSKLYAVRYFFRRIPICPADVRIRVRRQRGERYKPQCSFVEFFLFFCHVLGVHYT